MPLTAAKVPLASGFCAPIGAGRAAGWTCASVSSAIGSKSVHAIAAVRNDFHRLTEDSRENLMRGGDFREMRVRVQTNAFDIRHVFRRQMVVEVFGNDVRINAHFRTGNIRGSQPPAANDITNAAHCQASKLALVDLLSDLPGLSRIKNIVEVRQ